MSACSSLSIGRREISICFGHWRSCGPHASWHPYLPGILGMRSFGLPHCPCVFVVELVGLNTFPGMESSVTPHQLLQSLRLSFFGSFTSPTEWCVLLSIVTSNKIAGISCSKSIWLVGAIGLGKCSIHRFACSSSVIDTRSVLLVIGNARSL